MDNLWDAIPEALPLSDGYIHRLLVVGGTVVMRLARTENASPRWAVKLVERKPARPAAVALANKPARIAWVVLVLGESYVTPASQTNFLAGRYRSAR
jgi:transposase